MVEALKETVNATLLPKVKPNQYEVGMTIFWTNWEKTMELNKVCIEKDTQKFFSEMKKGPFGPFFAPL